MSTTLFKIGNTDVSNNIVVDTYSVYNQPIYKEYEDANGITHKRFIRDKIRGSFDMFFKELEDYEDFIKLIDDNTSSTNYSVLVTAYDTKRMDVYTINAFIEFEPTITQDAGRREYMKLMTIDIEER